MAYTVTKLLILANVIVFLLVFSLGADSDAFAGVFGSFAFSRGAMIQLWRWVTSLFLHASASHLFFNMLGLYFFGRVLENKVKSQWFIAVYFAAGLIGNFAFAFTSAEAAVGASGAIFGVMGAAMLLYPGELINIYILPLPLSIVAISFVIVETFVIAYQPQEFSRIATVAHIGGLITGSIFAFFLDFRKSMKGVFLLGISIVLLVFLGPVFGFIEAVGRFVWNIVDFLVGIMLYGLANALGAVWG